jgi:hypothetical protein
VTFLTIGFGEIYPKSLCGKAVMAVVGLCGMSLSAYIVAIVGNKMALTRSEK